MLVTTVAGQVLPAGAIKGGTGLAIRTGFSCRFSTDIDAAARSPISVDEHIELLGRN